MQAFRCWIHPLYLARWVLSGRELFPRRAEQGTHQLTVEAPLVLCQSWTDEFRVVRSELVDR